MIIEHCVLINLDNRPRIYFLLEFLSFGINISFRFRPLVLSDIDKKIYFRTNHHFFFFFSRYSILQKLNIIHKLLNQRKKFFFLPNFEEINTQRQPRFPFSKEKKKFYPFVFKFPTHERKREENPARKDSSIVSLVPRIGNPEDEGILLRRLELIYAGDRNGTLSIGYSTLNGASGKQAAQKARVCVRRRKWALFAVKRPAKRSAINKPRVEEVEEEGRFSFQIRICYVWRGVSS